MIRFSILTVSDKGSAGLRQDTSGGTIEEMMLAAGNRRVDYAIVPDDRKMISGQLIAMCESGANLILTTGGTGFSPRDVTPEATMDVIEKPVPGIPEAMRARSIEKTPMAMLSRATAGIRGQTLIVNLPGSTKAVRECLEVIMPVLGHAIAILTGTTGECGN